MKILGIDPGTRIAGYAVMEVIQRRVLLHDCGALELKATDPLYRRVGAFSRFFDTMITTQGITTIALETPFLGKNAQNFLKLGYLRGILYMLQDKHNLDIHEFSPREIKHTVTGYGGADKEQVARVMLRLFPSLTMPRRYDSTDALAVALCGAWQPQNKTTQHMNLF